MATKETLKDIGIAIQNHRKKELATYSRICAIGRAYCDFSDEMHTDNNGIKQFWITNKEDLGRQTYKEDGQPIYKNTRLGEILSKYHSGTRNYIVRTRFDEINQVSVKILSRATYTPTYDSIQEITIYLNEETKPHRFQKISDLISNRDELEIKLIALLKKQEEERKTREEAARKEVTERQKKAALLAAKEAEREEREAAKAEEERIKAERKRLKEEEEQIKNMERLLAEANQQIKEAQSFTLQGDQMRSQHILDEVQETTKRSHLYDGVPIVIEGGPGTGKTTTMIQRLKFLLSSQALEDYNAPLTEKQISLLTDPTTRDNNWLFFSPTRQLLVFLRHNMVEEDLKAGDHNTTILDQFCTDMLISYKLRNPETDGPFKLYKQKNAEDKTIIKDARIAVLSFEKYIINNIKNILQNAEQLNTSEFAWNELAAEIKTFCKRGEDVKDLDALAQLFTSMKDHELSKVKTVENKLSEELKKKALFIKNKVIANIEMADKAKSLFEKWLQDTFVSQDEDFDENDMDEAEVDEAESVSLSQMDFGTKLYQQIQPILRKLGLHEHDYKQKLSKRQNELYNIIKEYVDETPVENIGSLAWFSKKYAFLCRGAESNILNQIPRLYKLYRQEQIKKGSTTYNQKLLEQVVKKDNGKRLHREELELIIGVINHMLCAIYKKSRTRFESMKKNKYVEAYCKNVKPVIGIDEATDYSLIDYYFISSFLHYAHSSLTLCGDIMQGLNDKGIQSWNDLKDLFPNLEVSELKKSYRQVPTLVDMSKEIYKD